MLQLQCRCTAAAQMAQACNAYLCSRLKRWVWRSSLRLPQLLLQVPNLSGIGLLLAQAGSLQLLLQQLYLGQFCCMLLPQADLQSRQLCCVLLPQALPQGSQLH